MTIKDILVHLDSSPTRAKTLSAACELADTFDAHITGLHISHPPSFEIYGEIVTPGLLEMIDQQRTSQQQEAEAEFTNHLRGREAKTSFLHTQGNAVSQLVSYAALQDIVVVGQLDPDTYTDSSRNVPESVALESGRPAFVVPYIGCRDTIGKNILVAWNHKREAVRAVHDAMPFFAQADSVTILSVNANDEQQLPGFDIAEHLARHNVNVVVQNVSNKELSIADNLLSRAADYDSDMLVMGAYGHSRFREYALGGVTRSILKTMTIPVLLSH